MKDIPSELKPLVEHCEGALFGSNKRGLDYLKSLGLHDIETLKLFKIGFLANDIKEKLSPKQQNEFSQIIQNETVTLPLFKGEELLGLYFHPIEAIQPQTVILSKDKPPIWNISAVSVYPEELIITPSILDALALFQIGTRNVISLVGSWNKEIAEYLAQSSVRKIILTHKSNDEAKTIASLFIETPISIHHLKLPQQTENLLQYFQYQRETDFRGTSHTFASLISSAPRIGFKRTSVSKLILREKTEDSAVFESGNISYRVKGINNHSMRIVLIAKKENATHVEHLDLYGSRPRKNYSAQCAERLEVEALKVEDDLLELIEQLEKLREVETVGESVAPVISEKEKEEVISYLKNPELLECIASDIEKLGYAREEQNKKLAYIIATSRKLSKPLSAIFRAQSGCGKSFLMETISEMIPPEDVHYFSRLTSQALYYMEQNALSSKLLVVDERNGSEDAEYPIRTLQTRRVLKLAVPAKDARTGTIKTKLLTINGCIAYMESTTSDKINPENANRCFEIYLDESEEQTKAIFAAQKLNRSLESWNLEEKRKQILTLHHNAQRLLRPLKVIIPYVDLIEFPVSWLRGRRDFDRLLSLIEGSAFLHQYQRNINERNGIEYIEADIKDYEIAFNLASKLFSQSVADIPHPIFQFMQDVEKLVRDESINQSKAVHEIGFTRRMVRDVVRLPDFLIKKYMRAIEDLEYVKVQRGKNGGSHHYRLNPFRNALQSSENLISPLELATKWQKQNNQNTTRNAAKPELSHALAGSC